MDKIWLIAKKEIIANIKNFWIMLVAGLLMVTNLSIVLFATVLTYSGSHTDPQALFLSLIHSHMYLIPLIALVLSYDGILKEQESGTLELLQSYPIGPYTLVLGKWLSYSIILTTVFLIGFLPAFIQFARIGVTFNALMGFMLSTILLSIIFSSLGLLLSSVAKDRTFAITTGIVTWLFFVFLFDLGFISIVILNNQKVASDIVNSLLLLNPTEIFRIVSIMQLLPIDAKELFGLGRGILQIPWGISAMLLWILVPLIYTCYKTQLRK